MTPPETGEDDGETPAETRLRQPIVSVLGHVDHGKTTLLDRVRGTTVAEGEAGKITQHIGATEVPLETISRICGPLLGASDFTVPGLLFIDTPGHHAFSTLRSRGGALADLAVLVVDVNEGFMPQTREAVKILRREETPFVVAANKIDRLLQWQSEPGRPFTEAYGAQTDRAQGALQDGLLELIGVLTDMGFPAADRYDRVKDFQKTIGIVPVCAETGEGVPDLLMTLVGLAQRFLEEEIRTAEGPGRGTVLEVKEEQGLGTTLDVIVHDGTLSVDDEIVVGTSAQPIVTKVRALLKPRPLDEIRDPGERFENVDSVRAATGIKVSAPDLDEALAGAPLQVLDDDRDEVVRQIAHEFSLDIDIAEDGIVAKADTLGSLEALAAELSDREIEISRAGVGDVSRRDVVDAATVHDPLHRTILAFNVDVLEDARELAREESVPIHASDVIYQLLDDLQDWQRETERAMAEARRGEVTHPGKLRVLRDHTFRVSKPAIVGVRVLSGRIRPGQRLLLADGRRIGPIKSIREGDQSLDEARAGDEVAIALRGVTVGRQIDEEETAWVDVGEGDARALKDLDLTADEEQTLEEIRQIHRDDDPFWGM